MFKAELIAALRANRRHYMLDGAIFSRRIHRQRDPQERLTA
jgi:hypothetical protein